MNKKEEVSIYRPQKYLFYICISAFFFVSFLIFMISELSFSTIILFCMALLCVAAFIELFISKVTFDGVYVEIKGLLRKKNISILDIKSVKIEDHELWIYLKDGKIQRMPEWFADRYSLYKVLYNRLKGLQGLHE